MQAPVRFGPYRCPARKRSLDDIPGCGSFNTVASYEGIAPRVLVVDCLDCGLWFEPAQEDE